MRKIKKGLVFVLFLSIIAGFPGDFVSAEGGRFFIKSTSPFWQNTIGARNVFDHGFTADLSDLQYGILKLFRVDVEEVAVLHVLPDATILPQPSPKATVGTASPSSEVLSETDTPTPTSTPTATPKPKAIKGKNGNIIRYLPSEQTPWGIEMIYNDEAVKTANGGLGINVVVLDTGVNSVHPDLKNRVKECKDFTNFRTPIVDNQCDDKNGHGTHVAGIIAADGGSDHKGIYGVAPEANVWAYKVCDANGSCYADDIANGLREAAKNGAHVINMSFGTDDDIPLITDAVNFAVSQNVLLIAAAGNDGPGIDSIDYPGAYGSVVAVGAINASKQITSWSSRGNNLSTVLGKMEDRDIEFAAPGENIESTWKNGGYSILSGTSMATPFVAGLAAKFWQSNTENPAQATREFLQKLAKDIATPGEDNDSGLGLPQVPLQTP